MSPIVIDQSGMPLAPDDRQVESAKKFRKAVAVSLGYSSGKKCPPSTGPPLTLSAQLFQISSGPPSSEYQEFNPPALLQRAKIGHPMRLPLLLSETSCSLSSVAAARYSSQIA